MKILFVFKSENFLAPLGLLVISAIAKRAGHRTFLSEANQEDPLERVAVLKPDVVAYSSSTGEAKHYVHINKRIKERFPGVFTIMGGPHPTFFPDMISESALDAICRGEGDQAFVDVLDAVETGDSVDGIPNIVTQDGDSKGSECTVRGLLEDLDSLPFPDYELLYDNTPMGSYPLKNFMTSRGCPYPCTYCFNHSWMRIYKGKGRIVRRHSVDYVIEDIQAVRARWPLSCVKFYDDIFTYDADAWLEEFSEKYRKKIGLPFFILTRCDLLTEDMVRLLKQAGCRTISMSIEAGNYEIRKDLLKRKMTNEQIIKAHRLCEKHGIYTFTNNIIGLPSTNFSHDLESLELTLKCHMDWAEFLQFHPYPGTELGDRSIQLGLYTQGYEDMHTSYQYKSPLNCFTEEEKKLQRNLALLGPVIVVLPFLKPIIIKCLFRIPPNRFYTFLYFLAKQYVLRRKIYVTQTSFRNSLKIFARSLRQDIFRHTNEKACEC